MKKNKSTALRTVIKVSFFVLSAIMLAALGFVVTYSMDWQRGVNDKIMLRMLERQRIDIRTISKNTESLQGMLPVDNREPIQENKKKQISEAKKNLETTGKDFASALEIIKKKQTEYIFHKMFIGSINLEKSTDLHQMEDIWEHYNIVLKTVIKAESGSKLSDAYEYIETNSLKLCDISDLLQQQLLDASAKKDRTAEYMEFGTMGIFLVLAAFYLYYLLRFIILPYNQLYKGIADIGLSSYPVKHSSPTSKKLKPLVNEINDLFLKINYLISLIENINNNNSFMETLTYINRTFSVFIPYNYIGIALISDDKKMLRASYGVSDGSIVGMPEKIMGTYWPVKDTSLEPFIRSGEARIINDLEKYCEGKSVKPYNKTILEAGIRASIALPLKVSGEPVGMIFFSSKNKNVYNEQHLNILGTLANSIAISLNQNMLASEIQYSSILALAKLSEARDEDTGEHMERMTKYSRSIAQFLYEAQIYTEEITLEYIDQIERFSPLHDIGKVGIMDEILLKPGKLTPEEFNKMKKHTLFGSQVLKSADVNMIKKGKSVFGMGVDIAEGHHEKWDGSGYPYGRKETQIPLSARITAVADVFDALTSKRPYKKAFSLDESFDIIAQGRGTHFDPNIVDVFMKNRKRIEVIYYKYNSKNK